MPRILLQPQLTPTAVANRVGLYAKTISGVDGLVYQRGDGIECVISSKSFSWTSASSNMTASSNTGYFLNSGAGAFTVLLPASPTIGDKISMIDAAKTCGTNNVTIARNGKNIDGQSEDVVLDFNGAAISLVYSSFGWIKI